MPTTVVLNEMYGLISGILASGCKYSVHEFLDLLEDNPPVAFPSHAFVIALSLLYQHCIAKGRIGEYVAKTLYFQQRQYLFLTQ